MAFSHFDASALNEFVKRPINIMKRKSKISVAMMVPMITPIEDTSHTVVGEAKGDTGCTAGCASAL